MSLYNYKDITGQKFNSLLALKFNGKKNDNYYWLFQCDCGKKKSISKGNVIQGHTKSCGCFKRETSINNCKKRAIHKLSIMPSIMPFYRTWYGIVSRCADKNNLYYGGRGIKCFWKSFDHFRDDMYESYLEHEKEFGRKQTSIDRIDNNGNYEKSNCRWATRKEQQANRRVSRFV